MRRIVVSLACALVAACASAPPPAPPPPPPPPAPEPEAPDHPRTWAEVPEFYGTRCPPPAFTLDEPYRKTVFGVDYVVKGSSARRDGTWQGPIIVGVLGAIKDATDDTKANLQKAKGAFKKAKVNVILLNGDVAETAEISDTARIITEVFGDFGAPVLVHSGNSEWTSGFTNAFAEAEKASPAFFNMNLIRDLDLGGVHFVSLPGWSVRQFVKQGGCHYEASHVDEVRQVAQAIKDKGELVILTAHGPPRGPDPKSLDRTWDFGNVGDESLAQLLQDDVVRFGIFGHILEAGGRATDDATKHKPLKLPMKKATPRLFVNVGSASSIGLKMLDKKTSRGMAAIVTITPDGTGGNAKVAFVKLR